MFLLQEGLDAVQIAENGGDLSVVLDGVQESGDGLFVALLAEERSGQSNEKRPNGQGVQLIFVQLNPAQEELKSQLLSSRIVLEDRRGPVEEQAGREELRIDSKSMSHRLLMREERRD